MHANRRRYLRFPLLVVFWALGCSHPVAPPAAPQSSSQVADEAQPLDASSLSGAAKTKFESEKIEVVDSDSNASSYAFTTRDGEISKEEFVRRYDDVTGSTELDEADKRNPGTPLVVAGVAVLVASVAGGIAILAQNQNHSTTCSSSYPPDCGNQSASSSNTSLVGSVVLSGVGLAGLGLIFAGTHANHKGHELSRETAERYVSRYNRALLRDVLRRADSGAPRAGSASGTP